MNTKDTDMKDIPIETLANILLKLNTLESIQSFCGISSFHHEICKKYGNDIAKQLIDVYQINYQDPTNFIYIMNNESMDSCKKNDNSFNYKKILRLYLNFYNKEEIYCPNKRITSIPIYPKLKDLTCHNNELTELPEMPNLIELNCDSNEIMELKIYNKLEILFCRDNQLTKIPNYPKLKKLYCGMNDLETLPEFPLLEVLMCENNNINTLPAYPNLKELHCDNNINVKKSKYPNLKFLNDRPF